MDRELTADRVAAKQGKSLTCKHLKFVKEPLPGKVLVVRLEFQ